MRVETKGIVNHIRIPMLPGSKNALKAPKCGWAVAEGVKGVCPFVIEAFYGTSVQIGYRRVLPGQARAGRRRRQ